jgi:hypothetical protein
MKLEMHRLHETTPVQIRNSHQVQVSHYHAAIFRSMGCSCRVPAMTTLFSWSRSRRRRG